MGIFDFIRGGKPRDPRQNHDLSDEERLFGGQKRGIQLEIAKLKSDLEKEKLKLEAERDRIRIQAEIEEAKQDLADLQGSDEEEEQGGGMENALMSMLAAKFLGGQQQQAVNIPQAAPQSSPALNITDGQLEAYWGGLDKRTKRYVKALDDQGIKEELLSRMPDLPDEVIQRAIRIIRSKK